MHGSAQEVCADRHGHLHWLYQSHNWDCCLMWLWEAYLKEWEISVVFGTARGGLL